MLPALFLATVIGVSDGDTITVLRDQQPVKVRLAEIDAPEKKQPFGTRAKQALSDLVYKREVEIEAQAKPDRYGRTLAKVYVNGQLVNAQMVQLGLAHCYTAYLKGDWCPALQRQAEAADVGLWVDPRPVAPWDWRKHSRRK